MTYKKTLLNEKELQVALEKLAAEIAAKNGNAVMYLLSINERADYIAKQMAALLKASGAKPMATLNSKLLNLYKDNPPPIKLPDNTRALIITDVVHTGVSTQTIVDNVAHFIPHPAQVLTLVLNENIKLKADAIFAALTIPLTNKDIITVSVEGTDGKQGIELYEV